MTPEDIRYIVMSAALLLWTSWVGQTVMLRAPDFEEKKSVTLLAGFATGAGAALGLLAIVLATVFEQ